VSGDTHTRPRNQVSFGEPPRFLRLSALLPPILIVVAGRHPGRGNAGLVERGGRAGTDVGIGLGAGRRGLDPHLGHCSRVVALGCINS
jgi:hypothetical protein